MRFWRRRRPDSLRTGQLDSGDLETLVLGLVQRAGWEPGRDRLVVEVGTGGGRGSTVAIHRALAAGGRPFRLIGYEGDAELAALAAKHWRRTAEVRVVNEYFMHRDDVDRLVIPHVRPEDRDAYLPVFAAMAAVENFLATPPPGPIDLLFVDSVRYTHLAILRAAAPWLTAQTVVLMEDDIAGLGELAILERELAPHEPTIYEIAGHDWPLVEFRLGAASAGAHP